MDTAYIASLYVCPELLLRILKILTIHIYTLPHLMMQRRFENCFSNTLMHVASRFHIKRKLNEYAKNNRILVYKEDVEIIGFVVFESNRSTHYLRYWFVHPEHRDKKIGSILLNTFFNEGQNTRRQLFWVITDNENAIKRYRHYGYTEENLYDIVMSNK